MLLLAATVGDGSGSDQTNDVRRFSGLYQARLGGGAWTLVRQIPLDSANYFRGQTLHVRLVPGEAIHVVDTLELGIGSPYGFVARLNNAARFSSVRLDGKPVEYVLGGGLLYLRTAPRRRARLVLAYTVPENRPPPRAGPPAAVDFGAYHNTDVWHPFFMYDAEHDLEPFAVTVMLPAAYRLTTTLPQVESVSAGVRTVVARSARPLSQVALIYDRDWRVEATERDGLRVETFLTPRFRFSHDSLAATARRVYATMTRRFGPPQLSPRYLGEVEVRMLAGQGMGPRVNDMVTSGDSLMRLAVLDTVSPSFLFAHEIVHGWTLNATGLAANFLREGWATYAESLILREVAGAAASDVFWERQRTRYMTGVDRSGYNGGFEGRQSILGNPDNGQIHYQKGSWVFRSLEQVLGAEAFDRGIREFIAGRRPGVPAGYREFVAAMSHAAGRALAGFIMPWLSGRYIPDVEARVEGERVIVTQTQPEALFDLPLELALTTASTTVRRRLHLTHRADTLDVRDLAPLTGVRVDPGRQFLLRRHFGDIVRFALPASRAPGARTVELSGDFSPTPLTATRQGDVWAIELPMSEGRYLYAWRVDGVLKPPFTVRVVEAVKRIDHAFPK